MADLGRRFIENPLVTPADITPSLDGLKVECVLNPGVFTFEGKTWLVLRVAERPQQKAGIVSFPVLSTNGVYDIMQFNEDDPALDLSDPRYVIYKGVVYLSTISHLRLLCSENKKRFTEPATFTTKLIGLGDLETFGIEDCRVTRIDDTFYMTYTKVSGHGVGVGLMHTRDWRNITQDGMILPPHNKDCALFPEPIGGKYYCLHRPSGIDIGGNFIWLASSPDLQHWGDHRCIAVTRPGLWDSVRIGAGASPILTPHGWLEIYHGANAEHRYCLGALLLDRHDPARVLARSREPIMEPSQSYEQKGFFGNVVFTNGHIAEDDKLTVYYGASDTVVCGAEFSITEILAFLEIQ